MTFVVPKKLTLEFLGTDWHAAYINFSLPSMRETLEQDIPAEEEIKQDPKKYTKQMIAFAEAHFLDGKGWNGSQLVDLTAADIQDMPPQVFLEATKLLMGAADPKS